MASPCQKLWSSRDIDRFSRPPLITTTQPDGQDGPQGLFSSFRSLSLSFANKSAAMFIGNFLSQKSVAKVEVTRLIFATERQRYGGRNGHLLSGIQIIVRVDTREFVTVRINRYAT